MFFFEAFEMTTNAASGSTERKGTFKVEFLKDIERRMQTRSRNFYSRHLLIYII